MEKQEAPYKALDLRDFVHAYGQKAFNFCLYLSGDQRLAENTLLEVLESFGTEVQKSLRKKEILDNENLECRLYQMIWEKAKTQQEKQIQTPAGSRDLRKIQFWDTHLMEINSKDEQWFPILVQRLHLVDFDFLVPVVLKDILKLNDEKTMKVLSLRWGVYRHRLNRGRLDCAEMLKGKANGQTSSEPSTW